MKSKHYSKPTSKKEKVWKYIRRNKQFSFADAMIVCGVSANYLKTIIWHLKGAKYIELKPGTNRLDENKYYLHCRDAVFGVKSPSIVNGVVHDVNTNKTYYLKK